jgi:hypothetical protein
MKHILAAAFLAAALTAISSASAQETYYSYHPQSTLSLGAGFSPNEINHPKLPCVEFDPHPLESGALSTSFSVLLVRNEEQLRNALLIDSKIDTSYLTYSGNVSFNLNTENLFDHNKLTLVIRGTSEFGRIGLHNAHLTATAQSLIDSGHHADFASRCGTEVVSIERRGASIAAVITIEGLSRQTRTTMTGELDAAGSAGLFSGSLRVRVQNELSQAAQEHRLDIQVVATGGPGLSGFADTVSRLSADAQSIEAIQQTLGAYLGQFTTANSVPIGFHSISMNAFGFDPNNEDLWSDLRGRRLGRITQTYRRLTSGLNHINEYMSHLSPTQRSALETTDVAVLTNAVNLMEQDLATLARNHRACQVNYDYDCTMPALSAPDVDTLPLPGSRLWLTWESAALFGESQADTSVARLRIEGKDIVSYTMRVAGRDIEAQQYATAQNVIELDIQRRELSAVFLGVPARWEFTVEDSYGQVFQFVDRCGPQRFADSGLTYFACQTTGSRIGAWVEPRR